MPPSFMDSKMLIPSKSVFGYTFREKYGNHQTFESRNGIFDEFYVYENGRQILPFYRKIRIFCEIEGRIELKRNIELIPKNADRFPIDNPSHKISTFGNGFCTLSNSMILQINLEKLIIKNIQIRSIDVNQLQNLKYLKISNCRLKKINFPDHLIQYCNLSHNKLVLKNIPGINARILILNSNRIKKYASKFDHKFINLSNNPLSCFIAYAESINISNTRAKNFYSKGCKKLIANNVKGIEIVNFEKLIYVSLNNCGLTKIIPIFPNLKYLFAANNSIASVHSLPKLKVVNLSGNFLNQFSIRSVEVLNISKNQLFDLKISDPTNLKWIRTEFNLESSTSLLNHSIPQTAIRNSCELKYNGPERHIYQISYKISLNEILINLLVTVKISEEIQLLEIVKNAFESSELNHSDLLSLFDELTNSIYSEINFLKKYNFFTSKRNFEASFVMITESWVFSRSFYSPLLIITFTKNIKLTAPNKIFMFKNILGWHVIPGFSRMKSEIHKREYKLPKDPSDLTGIFNFLNYKSPISLECTISNSIAHLQASPATSSKHIFTKNYSRSFKDVIDKISPQIPSGLNIFGFGVNSQNTYELLNFETTQDPTFAFMKINHVDTDYQGIILSECRNAMRIVEGFCAIYCGYFIEKGPTSVILGFSSPLSAAQWGLAVFSAFKALEMDVSVGITQETVFRTVSNGMARYSGPVFFKLHRIASSGIGVFCCECVPIYCNNIVLVDEGERILKGYQQNHRIFSLKFFY